MQDLVRQDDFNRMFEPVFIESTGKSTETITKELIPIREEMKTLNKHLTDTTENMKDVVTMKQQQTPPINQKSNVFEQYLLKYGGYRVLDKYLVTQVLAITSMRWALKRLKLMKILDLIVDNMKYDGTTG